MPLLPPRNRPEQALTLQPRRHRSLEHRRESGLDPKSLPYQTGEPMAFSTYQTRQVRQTTRQSFPYLYDILGNLKATK
mgnify:CR=1 FL=1